MGRAGRTEERKCWEKKAGTALAVVANEYYKKHGQTIKRTAWWIPFALATKAMR